MQFWSSAVAGIFSVCLWLIGSVSLHGEHLDLTSLGRFSFVLDYVLKLHNTGVVLTLLPYCRRLPLFVSLLATDIFPRSLGYFFYFETSVELPLLLPSLFRKLCEIAPACLFLHP